MTVSVKQHFSGQNIFPATLNSHSTGLEDARTDILQLVVPNQGY